ncbi:MAG: RidA family protein [Sneathiella sp.]|nr:RidA family protein [Sneathiella sp.]
MTIERIEPGARMSQVAIHNDTIYLAGQVGNGKDAATQTEDMLAEIDRLLEKAGSSKSQILSATIWLATMDDFASMNAVWDAWIDPQNPPTRACGEARLATSDYLVEAIIVAAKG